ncbi:nicotinate (nicotinamide) nucleotide adenylyltransferase [Chlamydiota bacterium]
MARQIGLFGGTFNPVHFGHINLALELKEKKGLDEVWFIPTLLSPFRVHDTLLPPHHRLKMVELALEPLEGFKVLSDELDRPPPSYTIDTLKTLVSQHTDAEFSLLCGEDTLLRFQEWRDPLEIVRLVPLWIGTRPHSALLESLPSLGMSAEMASAIRKGIVPTRQLEISATEIRERLKKRLYCGHLLPAKVLDYISAHQLYFNALT